jgi:hypothetical protein
MDEYDSFPMSVQERMMDEPVSYEEMLESWNSYIQSETDCGFLIESLMISKIKRKGAKSGTKRLQKSHKTKNPK